MSYRDDPDYDPMEHNGQIALIVYPGGDRTKLDIVIAWYYERDDYDIACRDEWTWKHEDEAQKRAIELAEKHGLEYVGPTDKAPKYLD